MEGLSAGVSQYTNTRDGKTGDFSLPLIGVTVWEFIRELATIAVETVLNHIGNGLTMTMIGLCHIKLLVKPDEGTDFRNRLSICSLE